MKKVSVAILTMMVLLAIPVRTLHAQSDGTLFKVPFAFVVADKELPAGDYFVRSLYWNAVQVLGSQGKGGVITLGQPTTPPSGDEPKLIFHKYGKHYFLAEVRLLNTHSGRKLYESREEHEIVNKISKPETVEVAAK